MDIGEKILHNSISFLQSVSAAMPNKFAAAKSFYATKSSILQLKDNESKRLKIWKKEDMKCTRCCLSFNDYPPQVYLLRKKRPNRFAAKVTRKIEKKYPLTRYQLKYSERLKNINTRTIIRRCQQCKNEVKQCFKMPSLQIDKSSEQKLTQKKKKKRKDRFCGLKESVVLASHKKNEQKTNNRNLMGIRVNSKAKVQEVSKKHKMKTETYVEKKDSCVAAQQTPIKYNVIGKIESLKIQQLSGKHKRRNKKQNVVEQKSTKEKIIEKKKNKAINKSKKKLKNLLKESGKSKMPSKLVNFLQDL